MMMSMIVMHSCRDTSSLLPGLIPEGPIGILGLVQSCSHLHAFALLKTICGMSTPPACFFSQLLPHTACTDVHNTSSLLPGLTTADPIGMYTRPARTARPSYLLLPHTKTYALL